MAERVRANIYHSRPSIGPRDIEAVTRVLNSKMLIGGSEVQQFEQEFLEYLMVAAFGTSRATSSGSTALYLALMALQISSGKEVIIPAYSSPAVLSAVRWVGAQPILVDIEHDTYNMDPEDVRHKVTSETAAIVVPHMFGTRANIDAIGQLGVPFVEDCAQSINALRYRTKAEVFPTLAVFSFSATKMMTTCGQGGLCLSFSPTEGDLIREMTEYGHHHSSVDFSFNFTMTNAAAAMGRSQLASLDKFVERRLTIGRVYDQTFQALGFPPRRSPEAYYRYVISLPQPAKFIEQMKAFGVNCAFPVGKGLHQQIGIQTSYAYPNTERVLSTDVSIPLYPSLTSAEVEYICSAITASVELL